MSFKKKQWNPNGWYYDDQKGKWIGPDFRTETENREAAERKARYYERRKAEGREPTYEEWKAAREAEKHPE